MFKVKRGRRLVAQAIGVVVAGGGLAIVAAAAGSAVTYGSPYSVPFHQASDLPTITAAGFDGHGNDCGNPAGEDGWAFVVPPADPSKNVFVTLTVTFSPGGTQTITTFGPPNDAHAFAFSAPGAQLTAASATIKTATGITNATFFNLSHTCPATSKTSPGPSGSPTPGGSPTPSGSTSGSPKPGGSPTPSGSPTSPGSAPTPKPVHTNLPVTG